MQELLNAVLLKYSNPLEKLACCFKAKLRLDGIQFKSRFNRKKTRWQLHVLECRWLELMRKSGRSAVSDRVGERICGTEYAVWAAEFSPDIRFRMQDRLCAGKCECRFIFEKVPNN